MEYEELVHTLEKDGFKIDLYFLQEYEEPDWDFETEEEKQELLEDINCGNLLWFCAKVTASKKGIELAKDYLGGCCYKSVRDFVENSGYFDDMVETVITEADNKIHELAAA
jgi:hypothetical protein